MAKVVSARAWCNNEVAYLAWSTDDRIDGCLGFVVTRIDLDTGERRLLPTWVVQPRLGGAGHQRLADPKILLARPDVAPQSQHTEHSPAVPRQV
jgi:hypothetical protein